MYSCWCSSPNLPRPKLLSLSYTDQLHTPPPPPFSRKMNLALHERELQLRHLFAADNGKGAKNLPPHAHLIDVFNK